jgi:glyoxylase-like metal-dependent hydrolase (beta-lactamase superfamily II)
MQLLPVQGSVYLLAGAGGNVTLQVGEEGVLVVDTGSSGVGDELLAKIQELSDQPVRLVINTHFHPDHTGGNPALARAGSWAYGDAPGNFGIPGVALSGPRIVAHENVLARMRARASGGAAAAPSSDLPTETFFADDKEIFFNGEAIQLVHRPGHTDGDVLVFFRRSDVVSAGDLFSTATYPVIDMDNGGSVQGVIDALNHILDIAIPRDKAEGGTYVIPGHGRISDEADVVEYRDMLTIVRDRVQDLIEKGRTLAEVKAARPTLDYDGRYAADSDEGWTTDRFVEAVYRDLSRR